MRLTDIELKPVRSSGTLRAFCAITLDSCVKLTSLTIHEENNNFWITYPFLKTQKGELFPAFIFIDSGLKNTIEEKLILKLKEMNGNDR